MPRSENERVVPIRTAALDPYRLPDGRAMDLFGVVAHAPVVLADLKGATARALQGTGMSVRLREVLILRVLHVLGAKAEWQAHVALFRNAAALSVADLTTIADAQPTDLNADELVMVRLADAMCSGGHLDDRLWADVEATHGLEGAVEAVFVAAQYVKVALMNNAFALRPSAGS